MAALTADTVLLQRYQLIAPVEDRGLGETWEGVDGRIEGRRVLVKVLDPVDAETRPAVVAKLQSLRMFRHPGALAVTDHGVHDDRPFLVHDLPLVGSLASLLDRHRAGEVELPLDKVAALITHVAEVVRAGHDEPEALVHGALRPRAVMVPDDLDLAQTVVLDAGLRGLGHDPDAPKESAASARCLTPEQFADEEEVPRTDTFALGLLVLEILRAPPSGAVTPGHARYAGRADVPDAVWDVLLFATRLAVTERPSIEALADLLAPAWTAPPAEVTAPVSVPPAPAPEEPVAAPPPADAVFAPGLAAVAAPAYVEEARYEPRSSIPPGGFLGAMPALSVGTGPVEAPVEFGERTVALAEAPSMPGFAASPAADPLVKTRKNAPQPRAQPVADTPIEMPEERTIIAFAARMQAVDDMLSTVERGLPPELDAVAARFRAQMAASQRRDKAPGGMSLDAPRRPAEPDPKPVAMPPVKAPAAAPATPAAEPAKTPPIWAVGVLVALVLALVAVLALRHH